MKKFYGLSFSVNYCFALVIALFSTTSFVSAQCNFTVSTNSSSYGCYTTLEDVVWSSAVNATIVGNDLNKSAGGNAWNAGGFSTAAVYNNGYVETVVSEVNTARAIGLSNTNPDANISSILFAIYLRNDGTLEVYESNTSRGNYGSYSSGDTIRVRVERGRVKYYKNSTQLFISNLTPTLPLYVDASLNTTASTLKKVVIGNLSNGSFKATATTLGTGPSYQWKLNGANVGTNTATYSNNALALNDVVTCVLTPGTGGCSASPVTSNNVKIRFKPSYNFGDFYIVAASATSGCSEAVAQVVWDSLATNLNVSGNSLTRIQTTSAWDGGAASLNTVANNGYFQFTALETNKLRQAGLSTTNTNSSNATIQYAFQLTATGGVQIQELGTNRGPSGLTYTTGDLFKISVESSLVKYYQNGNLLYISGVAPTLPLLVDVSINQPGGTISNGLISNYSNGVFNAVATSAGTAPSYQWKLNGSNVGTNSTTYTNTTLAPNDVVSCVLTPDLTGCSASSYPSNTITYKTNAPSTNIEFYIQGTAAASGCAAVEEQVKWKVSDLLNVVSSSNNLTKIQSGGNWDGGAASYNTVSNNGYFQFTSTETNTSRVVGLSNSNTNASNTTVQYGIYLLNTGLLQIIESNANKGSFGSYSSNDVFRIAVEANVVKYYKNGTLLYISATAPTLPMLVDVSINTLAGTVTNALVGNYSNGAFTAVATNAGVAPIYQWKLNGTNVGTNSTSYSNNALTINDAVTCVLTPDLVGCNSAVYTSNTLTYKATSSPSNIEFYIQGTPAASACFTGEEQVKWKISDLNYVLASGNNLSKFQSNGTWDGGAASWNTVANNGYFQFTATETNTLRQAGLSTTNANSSNATIQYAFQLTATGGVQIQELGTNRGPAGLTYIGGDLFKISIESSVVKYYQNGNLLYISTVTPTLPMLVDVSINSINGTISSALIGNYSSGTYTATAVNAGTTPTYQWQVNASNVGTNSATYTNTTLVAGDVVTCILTPNITGCSASPVLSNNIVNKTVVASNSIEFYIQGLVATSACNAPEEQVRWKNSDLNFVQANGNNLLKIQSDGNWDGGAASWNTVFNNGYVQFTAAEVNKARMIGLSSTNANANYTSIQYAFYLKNNGTLNIFESGTDKGQFSTYVTNDVFKISVNNNLIKYYQNGNLLYTSTVVPTLPLLVDVSINAAGGTITNAVVSNYNVGSFAATAVNAGATPSYQWQVNGGNVGTNSATYTNVSLNNNDIVTCILTPSLPGCGATTYTSNGVTNKTLGASASIDFFIQGTVATAACNIAEEQVRWKSSEFNYVVITTGNNLNKVQSGNNWDGGAASWSTVGDNGYFQFTATETNTHRTIGLSTTNANSSNSSIQYAIYLTNAGTFQIQESGTNRGSAGTYIGNDVFTIGIESGVVKYYQNGSLLYISNSTPTLPMLVDASLYTLGATITNPVVGNFSTGTFTAAATNAGISPSYQWKLNGANVGTNSNTYTNTSLAINDVVTCLLTPNLGGCSSASYPSNAITNKTVQTPNIEFYIQGAVAVSACNTADEEVKWKVSDLSNLQVSGNILTKIQSDGNWDGGAASWNSVSNNGYLQFAASETNKARMIGLSSTNANSNFTSIQYAFYLLSNGTVQIYEAGTYKGGFGGYNTGDVFRITVENSIVKYYQNNTLLYTSSVAPVLPMLVDVSIKEVGGTISNVITSNYNTGVFNAASTNAGASPSYQWKLNGSNVGTNSSTYTNTTLTNNDVVSCVLTPNIVGCSGAQYVSNNITNKSLAAPNNLEFYIQGNVAASACSIGEEQVDWKNSDFTYVTGTGNNLIKVQSDGNWDGGAASWNTVSNNGYFQFTASETSLARMAGLSSINANNNYTTIQYAFYLVNTGSVRIFESGTDRGSFSTYTSNDVFKIAVEAGVVKYYQNGTLLYISAVAPTLPMLVDVSIKNVGGTITNAVVGNYSAGTFTATTVNAGASPSYQWKLNGSNVGTNSATYTNASLSLNDVISCVLIPSLPGCGTALYTSNNITNKSTSASSSIEFYILGTPSSAACLTSDEQVRWKVSDITNVQTAGNSLSKVQSNGNWDGGAASWNTVADNGYFRFIASETNTARMAGLSTANADANYTSIQYAFYLTNTGSLRIYELGNSQGSFGIYNTGDTLQIAVEAGVVKYYQNGNLLYISSVVPILPLLVDVSINAIGGTITNAVVSNYNTGTFTATASNAGASPSYQWKLNGVNVGTNSTNYTNTSLLVSDVVTCVLTPNLSGCGASTYNSNSITNKSVKSPVSIDFYIRGTPATSACNTADEQVRWKISDLSNLLASGNSLNKIQSNGNWDGGAASLNTVSNNGYFQFTVSEVNTYRAAGLSTVNSGSHYNTIQYAFYLTNTGSLLITESGTSRGTFGSYLPNDVLKIAVELNTVKYYQNGTLLYVSTLAPILPMVVDVSINSTGGTITNAIVSNANTGTFTAITTNAGVGSIYQWKLNGVNVGTNSATYTNSALNASDVLTCILTPNLGGCAGVKYTSNTITNRTITNQASIEFYVKGTAVSTACNVLVEQVQWKNADLLNVIPATNNLTKLQSNGNWDGGAASWNTVSNNGYLQFNIGESNNYKSIGLSTTNTDANYTSIQYGFYLTNTGSLQIVESGTNRGAFSSYTTSDTLKIAVESSVVKYYQNGTLLYVSGVSPTLPLLVDVSIYNTSATFKNVVVGNYNAGVFTAVASNAGASPAYQWKLNGSNVGTNSSTYTNAAITNNDVITCVLTPNLGGCSGTTYTSNSATAKTATIPNNVEFYIRSNVGASACNSIAEEQVKWKLADLSSNVVATNNSLNKIQSGGNWDGGAASWNTVNNNGYFQFTVTEVTTARMAGLSASNTDANFNTIQYAIYTTSGAAIQIYESGNNRGTFGTYAIGDVLKVSVESNVVKYYRNNVLLYVSAVVPTLPLVVDISINSTSGTITNAIVGNYTTNTFTASATNAGGSPSYQWKLNGTNVGTNSASYTNTSLVAGDQVTCVLSTSVAGCGALSYTSNTVTEKLGPVPTNLEFYVKGTPVVASCNLAEEQVVWKLSDLSSNTLATSNNLYKSTSNNNWDGGAASWNTVSNGGFFQFTASENNKARVVGLSASNASATNTTIQFGIYLLANGTVQIIESNNNRGAFGSYAVNDVFKIAIETGVIKYYKNATLLYTSLVVPVPPLLVDVSINNTGGTVTNALVSNYNSGTYTATAVNAGTTPAYQWQLNGVNVGTNSTTYTNASLNINDVITCILTPNLAGCTVPVVNSNVVTYKSTAAPAAVEFYIQGTAAIAACAIGEEQVRWKMSDLVNVQATGNNLNKNISNGNWDGGAASYNTVNNNGYLQFTATETNKARMAGLSVTNASSSYNTIQYAIYLTSTSSVKIYESGTDRGTFASYVTNDVFRITVESSVVKYYKNGTLLYISTVAPTVPMLVDVSINNTGGTITNALVGNLNAGSFTATAINAGSNPIYQWKVNGTNAGTNSSSYSNAALLANDVVTCVLTPDLGACNLATYTSNTVTNKGITTSTGIDFYIQGASSVSACNTAEEQVNWKISDLNNVQATGNNLIKIQSGNWDGGAASWNTVKDNGYFQFTASEINKSRMAGLSTTNGGPDYATIQYAFYLVSNGTVQIYESGNYRGSFGTYATNDVFRVAVEASVVKYYQNGTLIYISSVAPILPMLVDVSIQGNGGTITNAVVSNYNLGVFTAIVANAGASPIYQWKLNGGNVGTNSSTYTNTALNNGDVVTCVLRPNIGGCTTTNYTSNSITNRSVALPIGIDFYIQGVAVTSACNTAEEQVKWKIADLSNVQTTGNNLNKIQSNSNWDGGAASWNTVSNNGYFQFTATETNRYRAVGLSSSNASSHYNTIQYAFYLVSNGTVQIYESGSYRGSYGTYATNDVFKVAVEASVVKYYKNGTLLYISTVAPTLPMLVDVSIYNTGGTVTNAVVSNYNTGGFMATATNAGATPSYQWKVNGVNVGTNSVNYTNTALNPNDVVTCILAPNLGGCSTTTYTSNSITDKVITNPTNLDFYIQGTVTASACNTIDEEVKWKIDDLSNVQASSNNLNKIQSNGNWDGGAASWNTVKDNGYFQFTATETNVQRMAGLSNVNTNSNYNTIQYAIYLQSNSTVGIYESGTGRGTMGTYVTGDVFRIAVEAGVVKYYQNTNLLYISSIAPTLPLLVDVSINGVGGTITNALVSNYNTGSFIATAINAGASPSYQWKLNGSNVGTNSSTYTNTILNPNDVITCVLSPNLAGCNATTYTSNTLINKQVSAPVNMDFYIQGNVTASACNTASEQVKWKISDLNYVVATGNSLVKVQSNGFWDGGAASWNTVSNNGYLQFTTAESTTDKVVGLSTTNANSSNNSIQYGFYLTSGSALNILESGNGRGTFGNYVAGDLFKIAVEANVVKYYKNNVLLYISTVSPVLPLLVDVSIRYKGATVNNAIVSNYNTGTFNATAINAGASPSFQWKLNGTNVGTNSSTYTNSALASNDVISCVLTPSLGGCNATTYTSNAITNELVDAPVAIDFYVLGSPVSSSCANVEEQVRWKISDYQNVQGNGNSLQKVQSNAVWDGGAASWNTVSNNGYFQFTATETNKYRMVGLSSTNANSNYTSIQYAFYLLNNTTLQISESGNSRGNFGTYATNDVFKIAVQAGVVKYYKNGTLLYTSSIAPTLPLLVDVSLYNIGSSVTNAIVSNLNAGTFTAIVANAGASPTFQWKLNGANVGTNSNTYSNPSLVNNDVVSCVLTPNLSGCSNALYTSNTTIYRATTITTQPVSQSICTGGSATLNVVAIGNSLNYQWRRNGVNIAGAIASSYTISSATSANNGNYDVIVTTGGCTSNIAAIVVSTLNQWSGTTSTAWTNTANWTCGIVPNAATDVIIPSAALNMPTISSSVAVNSLTINTSGSVTNASAGTLTLSSDLVNNGTYTDNGTTVFGGTSAQNITGATNFNNLRLNNAAGLTLNNTSTVRGVLTLTNGVFTTNNNLNVDLYYGSIAGTGTGSTTGNIRFFKVIWSNRYHYISSPIPGRTAADWNDNVPINFGANTNMYYYNETVPDTTVKVGWTGVTALSQPLQTMTGYALYFKAFPTTILDVSGPYTHNMGTLNSGTLTNTKSTIPTFKPASDGWNHMGNPYPSTIDWNAAGWTKTGLDNAIYYWDPRTNRFSAYVAGIGTNGGTQYIGSMQGFFVKVTTSGGTGSLSMTNSVRTSAINVDVWRTASDESILRLTATSGTVSDETIVRLLDSTTTTFDSQFDAYKMMNEGQTPSLYSYYNTDNYAINSIPSTASNETIPVNLDAKFTGSYTFNADITGFEDADSLIFVDKVTNVRQDLRLNPTYAVDLATGNYRNRFYIQYNKKESVVTDTNPKSELSGITVYSFEQKVTINFSNTKVNTADVVIYDVKGNAVYRAKNQNVSSGKLEINLPFVSSGVYVVKIESGQASKTQEVYIAK